jgi:hypothetical protein
MEALLLMCCIPEHVFLFHRMRIPVADRLDSVLTAVVLRGRKPVVAWARIDPTLQLAKME